MIHTRRLTGWVLLGLLAATRHAVAQDSALAPELSGLGTLHSPVTTTVPRAQQFFDQGLRLLYAFNHAEAQRAFREAARLDASLAMAYWGQAMTLAPNLNAPMSAEAAPLARAAIDAAIARAAASTPRERALIDALAKRFATDGVGDRAALDRAYADAMQGVARQFPDDADAQVLLADALMNTMPWDYWQKDASPKPTTRVVLSALERVMTAHPDHPGAHHYYIHAIEASDDPDRALPSADRLGALMPSAGHMVHMPAHIYLRVGRYADASEANVRAIAADEDYLAQCQRQGLYPLSYYPHNLHFLWAAATLEGRSAVAIDAARDVAAKVPHHHAGAVAWTVDFPVTPLLAYARFGRWREILLEPSPPATDPYATGIWHYARALANVGTGRLDRAREDLQALDRASAHEAFTTTLKDSPLPVTLAIAARIAKGELAAREGRLDEAVEHLRQGIALEDGLPYNEPPVWHHPVRQVLGGVLLDAGRHAEAEGVYREDLTRVRENGWSLFGLAESLGRQGKSTEAADVGRRFATAWARADIRLTSSRMRGEPARAATAESVASGPGAGPTRSRVRLSTGIEVEYVAQGDATGVPVILLHGLTDSLRSYDPLLPHLPASIRAFAISLRGHGDSDRPDSNYAMRDMAGDVVAFMDAMHLDTATIVGHSMGARVAMRLAVDHPGRVRRLVLLAAFAPGPANPALDELRAAVDGLTVEGLPAFARAFQEGTIARPVATTFVATMVGESLKLPPATWRSALAGFLSDDTSSGLATVRMPVLLVWGERDSFVPRRDQDLLRSAFPDARLEVYAATGHAVHWEDPARVARHLLAFLGEPRTTAHAGH